MDRTQRYVVILVIMSVAVLSACGRQNAQADRNVGSQPEGANALASNESQAAVESNCSWKGEHAEIEAAKLYVEYNATDGDLGVHGSIDDHGWSALCIFAPDGSQILGVRPQSELGDLTMASIFFESREPEVDQFSFEDLASSFPEGDYIVRALSFESTVLEGAALFTHDIPAMPTITSPVLAEDEESAGDALVPISNLMIAWEDVAKSVTGGPVSIIAYEVTVSKVNHDDPHGFSQPVFDVHVPPHILNLSVSPEFLEVDTIYELEVLALEESGNQTISVSFFKTK